MTRTTKKNQHRRLQSRPTPSHRLTTIPILVREALEEAV